MNAILVLIISLFFAALVALLIRQTSGPLKLSPKFIYLGLLFIVPGSILYFYYFSKFETARQRSSWPISAGVVDTSRVIGERAFRPIVVYSYFVEGKSYQDTTDLHVPGFGGRLNRLDAAEKLAAYYHQGREIAVYYNPDNPKDSLLRAGASYTVYLSISLGDILMATGFILLLLYLFPRKIVKK